MTDPSRRRRVLNLALVAVLGVAVAVGAYLGFQRLTAPSPRPAPGWALLAEMPEPRGETAGAVADDRLFVIGGMSGVAAQASATVSIYSAGTKSWSDGPPLPAPRHHPAAVGLDGAVYVSGGAPSVTDGTPQVDVWRLESGADSWLPAAPLPSGRFGHRMVAVGGLVYVVGGLPGPDVDAGGGAADEVRTLIYDLGRDAWSQGAPLPLNRDHLAVVAVGEEIWAIGGRAGGTNHQRVDIYNSASDTWRDGPPLPFPVSGASEGVVDGVIMLSGGEDPGAGLIVDRHWRLDTKAGAAATWEPLAPPPLTVHGAPGAVLGGRFIVVSGSPRPGGQSSTAWTGATQVLEAAP
jgi:hypothetical protein